MASEKIKKGDKVKPSHTSLVGEKLIDLTATVINVKNDKITIKYSAADIDAEDGENVVYNDLTSDQLVKVVEETPKTMMQKVKEVAGNVKAKITRGTEGGGKRRPKRRKTHRTKKRKASKKKKKTKRKKSKTRRKRR